LKFWLGGEKIEIEENKEVTRLIGFALFNLHKGKYDAVETLLRKAYVALTGKGWDE